MTIVVAWKEENLVWLVSDTRISTKGPGGGFIVKTDSGAKIFAIQVVCLGPDKQGFVHLPKHTMSYGFGFAGAVLPATLTAVTSSTLLQRLVPVFDVNASPPRFEEIAQLVARLAKRFMNEHLAAFPNSPELSLFSAVLAGTNADSYGVALIEGYREENGTIGVSVTYPTEPTNADPWCVVGSGEQEFLETMTAFRAEGHRFSSAKRLPKLAVATMIENGRGDVGGAMSLGIFSPVGFEVYQLLAPALPGTRYARMMFNGIDLDGEVGLIDGYKVGGKGMI